MEGPILPAVQNPAGHLACKHHFQDACKGWAAGVHKVTSSGWRPLSSEGGCPSLYLHRPPWRGPGPSLGVLSSSTAVFGVLGGCRPSCARRANIWPQAGDDRILSWESESRTLWVLHAEPFSAVFISWTLPVFPCVSFWFLLSADHCFPPPRAAISSADTGEAWRGPGCFLWATCPDSCGKQSPACYGRRGSCTFSEESTGHACHAQHQVGAVHPEHPHRLPAFCMFWPMSRAWQGEHNQALPPLVPSLPCSQPELFSGVPASGVNQEVFFSSRLLYLQ